MNKIIIFLTLLIILVSCGNEKKEEPKQAVHVAGNIATLTDAQLKNTALVTGKLNEQTISSLLKVNGKVDVPPQNMVSISVPLGGYLKSTKLLPGMHVRKGETIAIIEDQQYIQLQQDYLTAKANFSYNESEYNRQKQLNQSKATSDKVFEQTKAAYLSQNILIKSLEQKLRLINLNPTHISPDNISRTIHLYAPINGYVTSVNVNIGKFVNPSEVLFELVDPTDIHLALSVFEKDIEKLATGQKVLAYTNTEPDKKHNCTIVLISKKLSNERSVEVHCHFEKYDKTLLPGMFMTADVEVKSNNMKVLPDDAIVRFENKQYAFFVKGNNKFEMVEVKTGNSENGFTEIIMDEKFAANTFVLKGSYNLLMKIKNTADE